MSKKLPKSVVAALETISRRLSIENANFGSGLIDGANSITVDAFVKEATRLYIQQDTKRMVDDLVLYAKGEMSLTNIGWIKFA